MEYLIVVVLVLLLVGGFVTFLALNAARKGSSNPDRSPRAKEEGEGPPGIGPDPTPLGDSAEHSGTQTSGGETVGRQEGQGDADGDDDRPESERLANRPF
jgi:hypothetical protein